MAIYEISGSTTDAATIHIIQNNIYKGRHEVPSGNYITKFSSSSAGGVVSLAVKSDGNVVGYGGVTAIDSSGSVTVSGAASLGVKSIQRGYIDIASPNNSATKTINSVDITKTIVFFDGSRPLEGGDQSDREHNCYLTLNNSTTLQCDRLDHDCGSRTYYSIIEFTGGITSMQRGNIVATSLYTNKTINSVDLTKTIINCTGYATNTSYAFNYGINLALTSATNLYAERYSINGTTITAGYEVVEFE